MSRKTRKKRRNYRSNPQRQKDYFSSRSILDLLRIFKEPLLSDRRSSEERFRRERNDRLSRKSNKDRYKGYRRVDQGRLGGSSKRKRSVIYDKKLEERYQEKLRIEKICKERRDRRESLFRTGKAGKGHKINTKRILSEDSKVRCS